MSDSTSPTRPTTNSTVPAVWMLKPLTCAVTAHFRIAPAAINKMLVPIAMAWVYPTIRITIGADRDAQMLDGSITSGATGCKVAAGARVDARAENGVPIDRAQA